MSRDNVHTHVNIVQSRVGCHLELEQIDTDKGGMAELNLNPNSLFQEIQFRGWVISFIEQCRLVLPSSADKGLPKYFVEVWS